MRNIHLRNNSFLGFNYGAKRTLSKLNIPFLYTNQRGFAEFLDREVLLSEVSSVVELSSVFESTGFQLRKSPEGAEKDFHCTERDDCQLVIVQQGLMQIELRDETLRTFSPGQGFLSMDFVPEGQEFEPELHGHKSRAVKGSGELITLFVKVPSKYAETMLAQRF